MTLKENFINQWNDTRNTESYLVMAILLPTGAAEIITNTELLKAKAKYYIDAYDDNFCLKTNPNVQIINFMIVIKGDKC